MGSSQRHPRFAVLHFAISEILQMAKVKLLGSDWTQLGCTTTGDTVVAVHPVRGAYEQPTLLVRTARGAFVPLLLLRAA